MSVLVLCLGRADLLGSLRIFSVYEPQIDGAADLDLVVISLAGVVLFWLVPGLVADVVLFRKRLTNLCIVCRKLSWRTC